MEVDMDDVCICQRPLVSVMCRNCGYRLNHCRKMKTCPEHPNVMYYKKVRKSIYSNAPPLSGILHSGSDRVP